MQKVQGDLVGSGLYAHFANLVQERAIDVDSTPLQFVADAFMCEQPVEVASFLE